MTNTVNPDYYNKHSVTVGDITVQPIDLIEDVDFDLGNVFKYLVRYQDKGKTEDLKKALTYLEHYDQRKKISHDSEKNCYKQAAKKLLLSQLSQENKLLAEFIDSSSPWEGGNTYLTHYSNFHKCLTNAILNKEKGLQLFSQRDYNYFSRQMWNFSLFVKQLMEIAEKVTNNKQSSHLHQVKFDKKDFEWFEGCVERIKRAVLTDKTHVNTYHYDGDSEFVLKYIRDVWLACFFNVLLAWPNKDVVEIGVFLTESFNTNSVMLDDNNTILFDSEAMKANCRICEKLIKDIGEYGSNDPLISLFYSYSGLFNIDFFKDILKVLFSEENAIAMN